MKTMDGLWIWILVGVLGVILGARLSQSLFIPALRKRNRDSLLVNIVVLSLSSLAVGALCSALFAQLIIPMMLAVTLFSTLFRGVILGALLSLVLFIPTLRERVRDSLLAKIMVVLSLGSLAAGAQYITFVKLAKLWISIALTLSLTLAVNFQDDEEYLASQTNDIFLCELAPSKYADACERSEQSRFVFGEPVFSYVGRIKNPAIYLITYVGSSLVVVVITLLDRKRAPSQEQDGLPGDR